MIILILLSIISLAVFITREILLNRRLVYAADRVTAAYVALLGSTINAFIHSYTDCDFSVGLALSFTVAVIIDSSYYRIRRRNIQKN